MLAFLAQLIPLGYRGHDLNSLTSSKLSSILSQIFHKINFFLHRDFLTHFPSSDFCRRVK